MVAEGVECTEVQAALAEAWCDAIQGFLTGRPMPADRLEAWMAERDNSPQGQLSRM